MAIDLPQHQDKRYIFLDTCVFFELINENKSKSEAVQLCMDSLKNEYRFGISEITVYEFLQGRWGKQANRALDILKVYEWVEISRSVLYWAAYLSGLYFDEGYDYLKGDKATADKIIAATAVVKKGLVLTENHKDFPHPFFNVEQHFPLSYEARTRPVTLDITLYKPNIELLVRRLREKQEG